MDAPVPDVDPVATAVELSAQLAEVSSNSDLSQAMRKLKITDPLVELCPSLETLQRMVQADDSEMSLADKKKRAVKVLLRTANSGDADLLSWILSTESGMLPLLPREATLTTTRNRHGIDFASLRDDDGIGPVNLAASSGNLEVVRLLLSQGADVNERDACGWTPLMWAANSSNVPLTSFLLSQGADVEARSHKGTSCEDFILSVAPESLSVNTMETPTRAGPFAVAGSSRTPINAKGDIMPFDKLKSTISPKTSRREADRELIADMILEHQKAGQTSSSELGAPFAEAEMAKGKGVLGKSQAGNLFPPSHDNSPRSPSPLSSSSTPSTSRLAEEVDNHMKGKAGDSATNSPQKGHRRLGSLASNGTRRLLDKTERVKLAEQELRARELAEGRKRALLDIALMLEVDYESLVGDPPTSSQTTLESERARRRRIRAERKGNPTPGKRLLHSGLASGCGALEVGSDPLSEEFDFEKVQPDQMLVFGRSDVLVLIDYICVQARPVRAPWTLRALPANLLYLCARYACSCEDEELLEELMAGAIDKIEESVYEHPMDMLWLVFWIFNCTLLLHYFQTDAFLCSSEPASEYAALLTDLVNEIYVFIIRDAERRTDKVLDAAMLEHESLPSEDIRYEGDWNFMKSLAGSVKSMGSSSSASAGTPQRKPLSGIFGSSNPAPSPRVPQSNGFNTPPNGSEAGGKRIPPELNLAATREASASASAAELLAKPSPRTVTTLLTSTLQVMQLFEVNPAIIVQILSQVLFWVGCELFNRVISNKKYLSRSKAMQIRLNISALEDWARNNALPLAIVHQHLAPLSQLVSWIQCQSSLRDFDGLITTLQGLKALNPLQLRKVLREYRYEVGEARMSDECAQYLLQLHDDWERSAQALLLKKLNDLRRAASHSRDSTITQKNHAHIGQGNEDDLSEELDHLSLRGSPEVEDMTDEEKAARHSQLAVDALFEPGSSMSDYAPPWTALGRPAPNGELVASADIVDPKDPTSGDLLNSREMLPFSLPSSAAALIVTPGDAFNFGRGHFNGTGTPTLKALHALSPRFPQTPQARGNSVPGSPRVVNDLHDADTDSVSSSANTASSASSRQSLFAIGHGFGAGSYWKAVPLLPEGTLEKIDAMCRSRRPAVESRLTSLATWDSPRLPSQAPSRASSFSVPRELDQSVDSVQTTKVDRDASTEAPGEPGSEQAPTMRGHARKVSNLSAKPPRLVIPKREDSALKESDEAVTPIHAKGKGMF